jgi:DNA-binding PadR family transcriptional regulator
MKLGYFKYNADKVRKPKKLTFIDFLIVLYVSEQTSATKYDIKKFVTNSNGTVSQSLTYLVKNSFLRVAREHKAGGGISRQYVVGVKGRHMVGDFLSLMNAPII